MPETPNLPPAAHSQVDQIRNNLVQNEIKQLDAARHTEVERQMMHHGADPEATIGFSANIQPHLMDAVTRMVGNTTDLVSLVFGKSTGGWTR